MRPAWSTEGTARAKQRNPVSKQLQQQKLGPATLSPGEAERWISEVLWLAILTNPLATGLVRDNLKGGGPARWLNRYGSLQQTLIT